MDKKIGFFVILFLLLNISAVLGNELTYRDKLPPTNYGIVFHNLNTSLSYISESDDFGNFVFPTDLIEESSMGNIIEFVICSNFTKTETSLGHDVYCKGHRGYFPIIDKIENMNIKMNSESMVDYIRNGLKKFDRIKCSDENLYFSSLILSDNFREDNGIISYEGIFSNYTIKTYTFKPLNIYNLDKGQYTISHLLSDGPNVILDVGTMVIKEINITNPYPEKKEGIIKTTQKDCYFKNGKNTTRELFEPNETKGIVVISKEEVVCNEENIESNFIDIDITIGNINITIFEISIISISIVVVTIALYLYKRRKKQKK